MKWNNLCSTCGGAMYCKSLYDDGAYAPWWTYRNSGPLEESIANGTNICELLCPCSVPMELDGGLDVCWAFDSTGLIINRYKVN